jgi:uncharacterized membrane protein
MSPRTLKALVPITLVLIVVIAIVFFPVAVGPIAIFGAVGVAVYFSVVRQVARNRRAREADEWHDPDMAR